MTYKSVSYDQTEIIKSIIDLHCPDGIEADITYGNGAFYKEIDEPKFKSDICPQVDGVIEACSTNLPYENETINSIMFDPPFLTYIKQSRDHNSIMAKRFGGYWAYDELAHHYNETCRETYRVLKKKGVFIVKCQDIIHNHKIHCTHQKMINWCEGEGYRLLDLFILPAKHRMPMPGKGRKQKHARIHHSYFLVFLKG